MEGKGLLRSEWKETKTGPNRRVYWVTKLGAEVLKEGLEIIVKRKPLTDNLIAFYQKHFAQQAHQVKPSTIMEG